MENAPLISVIMPVYNTRAYLEKSLDSVLGQTWRALELIVVDDGSTDGSGELCDEYARRDPRVRVIHQENGGVSRARNRGLDAARGAYIAWLDSDDYMKPEMLERLMRALTEHGKQIAMCNYINVKEGEAPEERYHMPYEEKVYPRQDMVGLVLGIGFTPVLWANLMARELYEGVRFPEGKLFEDVRNTYKLQERADGAVFVAEPLLVRVRRADSLCQVLNLDNRVDGCYAYMERYEDAVRRWPQYGRAMLVSSARTLALLRTNVLHNPLSRVRRHRADLAAIGAFYRKHGPEILPRDASWAYRLEFWLMTSGTHAGFVLSKALDVIVRHPISYIKKQKTPDLPPF